MYSIPQVTIIYTVSMCGKRCAFQNQDRTSDCGDMGIFVKCSEGLKKSRSVSRQKVKNKKKIFLSTRKVTSPSPSGGWGGGGERRPFLGCQHFWHVNRITKKILGTPLDPPRPPFQNPGSALGPLSDYWIWVSLWLAVTISTVNGTQCLVLNAEYWGWFK